MDIVTNSVTALLGNCRWKWWPFLPSNCSFLAHRYSKMSL